MNGLRKIIYIFIGQLLDSLSSVRVWIGYLIGITIALRGAYSYSGFAGERVFQLFEPFISNFTSIGSVTFMLIGFVIIISDAPFINNRSTLALYRTSRGQWFWGMSIYIFVHAIFYYIFSFLASCLWVLRSAYTENIWSSMMKQLVKSPPEEAIYKWRIVPPDESIILRYSPNQAMLHTVLLALFYCIIIAIVIFLFNSAFNRAVGTAIAAAIHIIGFIMAFDNFNYVLGRFSLIYNSMFLIVGTSDTIHLSSSYLLEALVLCILLFCGPSILRRADFRYASGEKNE